MRRLRVWIDYQPQLYTEIFKEVFQSLGLADILTVTPDESESNEVISDDDPIDLVVLSLDNLGLLEPERTPEHLRNSKTIAFSPKGDYGLLRSPGKTYWQEIHPFGLEQLIDLLSREQPG